MWSTKDIVHWDRPIAFTTKRRHCSCGVIRNCFRFCGFLVCSLQFTCQFDDSRHGPPTLLLLLLLLLLLGPTTTNNIIITRNKSNDYFESMQYRQDVRQIAHYHKRKHCPSYTRCSENHNNTCAENRKIRGLKFDTLYWRHPAANRKIWI